MSDPTIPAGDSVADAETIRMVLLRDGTEVPAPVVAALMLALRTLGEQEPIALYELAMLVRDRDHRLFGNTGETLRDRALIEANGRPHDLVCDVVRNAVEGEGLDMRLVNPIAAEAAS